MKETCNQQSEKITLPKELQKQMLKFFLKTSIPRKKKINLQSENESKTDWSVEE